MFNTEEFKKIMKKYSINVGEVIKDLLLRNLPKEELEKELIKVKERVERIKLEQQEFIKNLQEKCPHKHTKVSIYNDIKHTFCKDCLKQLKIEKIS